MCAFTHIHAHTHNTDEDLKLAQIVSMLPQHAHELHLWKISNVL